MDPRRIPLLVPVLAACAAPQETRQGPIWIGHRGASWIAPENTLASVNSALGQRMPPDFVEVDVYATADGALAILHDDTLDRTTNLTGGVADLTWEEVRLADAGFSDRFGDAYPGERVPSLEEVLDAVDGERTGVMIEVKAHGLGGQAAQILLERKEVERHVLASFHPDVIVDAKLVAPQLRTLLLVSEPGPEHIELARWTGASILGVSHDAVDAALLESAHEAGLALWSYTVNDPQRADELLALGVDGIISDRVDLMRPGWLANGVTAHRGASGDHPENTLAAFEAGIAMGADWLECDVQRTADGVLVVTHDATTGRVAGRNLVVAESDYASLAALDVARGFRQAAGQGADVPRARMPRLEDVLRVVLRQRRTRLSIQPRTEIVDECVALVRSLGAEGCVGFNDGRLSIVRRARELMPEAPVFWDVDATATNIERAAQLDFTGIVMPYALVTPEKVAALRAAGLEPGAWTVDDPATLQALLAAGVERIYTDDPETLLQLVYRRRSAVGR